jgi:hypothetical protein
MKEKRKRQLHPDELRFILFAKDASRGTKLVAGARLHLMRETVNGRKIAACTYASIQLHQGAPYYNFPFLAWFVHTAPICRVCHELAMEVAAQFSPIVVGASNTPLNSTQQHGEDPTHDNA